MSILRNKTSLGYIDQNRDVSTWRSVFQPAAELLESHNVVRYLISKVIERGTTGQLFGPSGGGKTFLALDMALAVATGGRTLDSKVTERGVVLYLAGEGRGGLSRRIEAWRKCHEKSVDDLKLFHVSRGTIDLNGDRLAVEEEIKQIQEFHGQPVALIIIDTLARHLDGDENSTRDMSAFIKSVDELRAAFPGSTALIVHHTGNSEVVKNRSRGSSALKAAMDFEVRCDSGLIKFIKMKDGEEPPDIEFKLCKFEIGMDDDGEPITSCIVKYGERSIQNQKTAAKEKLSDAEKNILGIITEYPGSMIDYIRDVFYERMKTTKPESKQDTLRKAFSRAIEGLLEKNKVFMESSTVHPGQPDKPGKMSEMSCSDNQDRQDSLL